MKQFDPGVGHEYVDASMPLRDVGHDRVDGRAFGDIELQAQRPAARHRFDSLAGGVDVRRCARGDDDFGALLGQTHACGATDAGSRARDHGHAPAQPTAGTGWFGAGHSAVLGCHERQLSQAWATTRGARSRPGRAVR